MGFNLVETEFCEKIVKVLNFLFACKFINFDDSLIINTKLEFSLKIHRLTTCLIFEMHLKIAQIETDVDAEVAYLGKWYDQQNENSS